MIAIEARGAVRQGVNEALPFDATVSRRLVHKREISEVFLTDAHAVGPNKFILGAVWPRHHLFYRTDVGGYDSLLAAETLRQATIFVGHQFFDVPLGQRFLMESGSIKKIGEAGLEVSGPTEVVLTLDVEKIQRRGSRITGFHTEVSFVSNDVLFAHGRGDICILEPQLYTRIRGNVATVYPPPSSCDGASLVNDYHISADEDGSGGLAQWHGLAQWCVSVLSAHPVFFDHPVDHLPGMLVMEAIRQAAQRYIGCRHADFALYDVSYRGFLEMDRPTYIRLDQADLGSPDTPSLFFSVIQDNTVAITVLAKLLVPQCCRSSLVATL
jgi:hypothetical protein